MKMSPLHVRRWVKLGSRRWSQVRLPEHSKEPPKGEAHLQGRSGCEISHADVDVEVDRVPAILMNDEGATCVGEEMVK